LFADSRQIALRASRSLARPHRQKASMPLPRAPRSFASRPTTVSAIILASLLAASGLVACNTKQPHADKAGPGAEPKGGADAKAEPEAKDDPADDFKPLHPGFANQRDPKGGFYGPTAPPAPTKASEIQPIAFNMAPAEIKLTPVKDVDGHCGEIEVGGEKVFLDCMTDDYGTVAGAAKSVMGAEDVAGIRSKRKLPEVVDHRKDGTEGPVMSQGRTSACTSFSLVAAADHAAARFLGHPGDLSPMHAWARYHSPRMSLADSDNVGKGLTDLTNLAFDPKLANAWQHGKRVEPGLIRKADSQALVDITNITRLDSGDMREIKSALAAGQDIWFSIKAAHGLQKTKKEADGESMVSHFDYRSMPTSQRSAHALVLAGYEVTPKGTFFLIHNSWGPKWGTDGYAWIWEKTLRANISDAYVLQVHPTALAHAKRPSHAHKFSVCRAGLVPDAATTQCVPACGDHGPRVNGVCPTAGQCPDGEVNLYGKCELSAPILDKTMSNGVKMTCGLSGCVYAVPNGTASCTQAKGCEVSCAAPRFMLESGSRGLACSG
jgi:hypothetical protein